MILKLVLELLHLLPQGVEQLKAALAEMHSADKTGTKVANIATIAASLASQASAVISDAAELANTKP